MQSAFKTILMPALVIAVAVLLAPPRSAEAQDGLQYLGLGDKRATSISLYGGVVAVGTDGNGVMWRIEDTSGDTTWNQIALDSLTVETVYAHKSGPIGWAIGAGVSTDKSGTPLIYCSQMGGEFESRSHGIADSLTSRITSMAGFPDPTICGETYAAGDRALYRRPFGDTTWSIVFGATVEGNVLVVAAKESAPGVVLAGGAEGFAGHLLIKSTDFGETWSDVSPLHAVNSVDFAGEEADIIFVTTYDHVRRSTDGGASWVPVFAAPPNEILTHVLYDSVSATVYVAGRRSDGKPVIFSSRDGGTNWQSFPLSLTGPVEDMRFGEGTRWIYFVTRSNGAYRLDTAAIPTGVRELTTSTVEVELQQNFPNPVTNSTTIAYSVSRPSVVTISVHDLLGRSLASWTKQHVTPGRYGVTWSRDDAASGVYLYRASTGGSGQARMMTVR